MRVLFPSSYLHPDRVDEDLITEYEAAVETGCVISLFDYDEWVGEEKLVIRNAPEEECIVVYRGWMLKPDQYKKLYHQLIEDYGMQLVTSPDSYEKLHVFPNVYPYVKDDTARILTYSFKDDIQIEEVLKQFPRFMVKDFTKSVKGTSFPKFFDNTYTQDAFAEQMQVFYQYRGKLLIGGICIKEYLDLRKYGETTNEFRVFYMNHVVAIVSGNSNQGVYTPKPPMELIEKYRGLDSLFYTIDYAETEDGEWKIIEAGDGQVSGLTEGQNSSAFFRALIQSGIAE